jgi:hypothetical protein
MMKHLRDGPRVANLTPCLPLCAIVAALVFQAGCGKTGDTTGNTTKSEPAGSQTSFMEVTSSAGITFMHQLADGKLDNIMESDGAGGTVLDFDNDGWMDLYLVNSGPAPILSDAPPGTVRQPNRLFRNLGDGTFKDVTESAGVAGHGFGTTAAAADYDNDGDTDLLVVNFGGLILYQNQGNGTFTEVTQKSGLTSTRAGISATFVDVDGDGYLDLFVGNYLVFDPAIKVPPGANTPYPGPLAYEHEFNILYRNRGDGTFEDVSEAAGVRIPNHRAMSVTALDFDLDGDQDLYVSNDGTPNLLLVNDGKGHFKDEALQRGVAFNQFGEAAGSMGATIADATGDGLPDLFVTRFGNASFYVNSRGGLFDDRAQASGALAITSPFTGWGGAFMDFDNDGDCDLLVVNGHAHFLQPMPCLLLVNTGTGTFQDGSARAGAFFQKTFNARGCMVADFDNDGRMDAAISALGGPAVLVRNTTPNANHWITLRLEGVRCNRDGFGSQVRVIAGGKTQYAEARCPTSYVSQHDTRLHFGLGPNRTVERIEIRWPNGQSQSLANIPADRVTNIRQADVSGDLGK